MALHHPTLRTTPPTASMDTQNIDHQLQGLMSRRMHLAQHFNTNKEDPEINPCFHLIKRSHNRFHVVRISTSTSISNHPIQCDPTQLLWLLRLRDMVIQHHTAAFQTNR
jgi:hypothetical protein